VICTSAAYSDYCGPLRKGWTPMF